MNLPKNNTTFLFQNAIRDIRACRPDPLDPEDIVWIWQLSLAVTGANDRPLPFTRAPIFVPRLAPNATHQEPLLLYRISLQALNWLASLDDWWKHDTTIPGAYACAFSDGANHPLFSQRDRNIITFTLNNWAAQLTCSHDDLRHAVHIQTGFPDTRIETEKPPAGAPEPLDASVNSATQWGPILALLAGAYAIPPWDLLLRPFRDIQDLLDQLPAVSALHGVISDAKEGTPALANLHEAVLFLKKGNSCKATSS